MEFGDGFADDIAPGIAERLQKGFVDIGKPLIFYSDECHQGWIVAKQPFEALLGLLLSSQVLGDAK